MPGQRIKQRREKLGLSQMEIADQLFMSQSTYSRIESRETTLTVDVARRIAAVLRCTLDDLLPDEAILENNKALTEKEELSILIETAVQKQLDQFKIWWQEQAKEVTNSNNIKHISHQS
jgi:transcriptional regulator with XRE-family HTH domain